MKIFEGRIARRHYLIGNLLSSVLFAIFTTLISLPIWGTSIIVLYVLSALTVIGWWAFVLFGLSLHIRRFHDRGDSGWGVLFMLIPIVNIIFFLILLFEKGDEKRNEFGDPVPKDVRLFDILLGKNVVDKNSEKESENNSIQKRFELGKISKKNLRAPAIIIGVAILISGIFVFGVFDSFFIKRSVQNGYNAAIVGNCELAERYGVEKEKCQKNRDELSSITEIEITRIERTRNSALVQVVLHYINENGVSKKEAFAGSMEKDGLFRWSFVTINLEDFRIVK